MRPIPAFRVTPTDGVVRLREWRPTDVADMTAACRDPEIARWTMVPDDYRESDARAFIASRDAAPPEPGARTRALSSRRFRLWSL